MKTARLIALVTALLLLLSGCAAGPETEKTQRQLYAMDTVMLLTAYGRTADAALDAETAVDFLRAHPGNVTLGEVRAAMLGAGKAELPELRETERGLRLIER